MHYVDVILDSPGLKARSAFSYEIPPSLNASVGDLVLAPFGSRQLQGVVSSINADPPPVEAKAILEILEPQVVWPWQVILIRWLADYYCCSLSEALRLILPSGLRQKPSAAIRLSNSPPVGFALSPTEQSLLDLLENNRGSASMQRIRKALGKTEADKSVRQLVRGGFVERVEQRSVLPAAGVGTSSLVRLNPDIDVSSVISTLRRGSKQRGVVDYLVALAAQPTVDEQWRGESATAVMANTGCAMASLRTLAAKGIITVSRVDGHGTSGSANEARATSPLTLTPAQQLVWTTMLAELAKDGAATMLLHGVTGSGKTELYLWALAETVRQNKQALILVPEIALTPQTIQRFNSRFPGRVAVIHSQLGAAEVSEQWRRVRYGGADIVIGSRSALFAPLPRVGLIVLDEEHEWAYKQDNSPRYHARDVALKLAEIVGAKVILGSATPDVASYYHAKRGRYTLLSLPERIAVREGVGVGSTVRSAPANRAEGGLEGTSDRGLPSVRVVDMRQELRQGNRSIFSRPLVEALNETLERGQQSILYINRRGESTFVVCRDCGYVVKCRRCDIPLVYHRLPAASNGADRGILICHQCNRRGRTPTKCPSCEGSRIRYFGVGTQKVESEVQRLFPGARIARWDRDVTSKAKDHENLLHRFGNHEADVLVGTQMVAKGLDIPLVTLVGVVEADTAINLPDLRAGERTFQLLTQVSGRAGRGDIPGRVIVQTYSPNHYAIQAAAMHDYEGFYAQEIEFRLGHGYPPFQRLARLVYSHWSEDRCKSETARMAGLLKREIELAGADLLDILGPAPAYYHRVRGNSRWQIILRGSEVQELLAGLAMPDGWQIDIDPVSLL